MPLVNASTHQHLLKNIPLSQREDRPDILHFGLLTVLGYTKLLPQLEVFFGTNNSYYAIDSATKLPRSQKRFYGIMEQVLNSSYAGSRIKQIEKPRFYPDSTILFTPNGRAMQPEDFDCENFIFGGFAHGDYRSIDPTNYRSVSLASSELELWTAISLFLAKYLDFH